MGGHPECIGAAAPSPTNSEEPDVTDAQTQPALPTPQPSEPERRERRRGPIIAIIVLAVLLLITLIVVAIEAVDGHGLVGAVSTPSATTAVSAPPVPSTTPVAVTSTAPSASPTPTAKASTGGTTGGTKSGGTGGGGGGTASNPLTLTASSDTTTLYCNKNAPAGQPPLVVTLTWKTTGASQIFFGVDTSDAQAAPFATNLPPSGTTSNSSDFSSGPIVYGCYEPSHRYTFTAIDAAGHKISRTLVVTNKGDQN